MLKLIGLATVSVQLLFAGAVALHVRTKEEEVKVWIW